MPQCSARFSYSTKNVEFIIIPSKTTSADFDRVSDGSNVGERCIIRSGTVIYEDTEIHDEVETGHMVLIREKCEVGSKTLIGTQTVLDGEVKVGSQTNIQTGVYLPPKTIVGNHVFLGPYANVTNDRYPLSKPLVGVNIEDGAIIGAGAVLIAGITIGENAVIAAGSVVTKDTPPNMFAIGNPARITKGRAEYEKKKNNI